LKLSQKPFCIGLPGAMKCQSILCPSDQAGMTLQVNSVPLSETIMPGLPLAVSWRATGGLRPGLMLAQNPDNLLFRKLGSFHLSVLQKAGL
jgi:hypothetical protein